MDPESLGVAIEAPAEDMLALHDALRELEDGAPRPYRLVMLRFFAGLNMEDAAAILEVSLRTAERDWQFARTKLYTRLTHREPDSGNPG